MFTQMTTYALFIAISIQVIFGGLNERVSICLGGGHVHETEEMVDHCGFECSHHDDLFAPSHTDDQKEHDEHIDHCDCTDLELGLIALITTLRVEESIDDLELQAVGVSFFEHQLFSHHNNSPPRCDVDIGKQQAVATIRTVCLRL
ncbi:MAG: hypothetical protein CMJ38_07970 [Phycisphaerae bacterium]|nr:hypothetical protein [Phycisphaerae bacterium]